MTETQRLLADYVDGGSEAAFRELVERYVNLVYSTAFRLLGGDADGAEDVTQTVFLRLSRQAGRLARESSLGGWLHRDTCFVAAKSLRRERRRRAREREAAFMNSCGDHSAANLEQLAPLLDQAINQLGSEDRTAILLRFFEQRDFRSVGLALGSNEDAARKRVGRALEKLEVLLRRRGLALSAAALATALADQAVTAAPAGLAGSVAGTVLAVPAAGLGIPATLIKIMARTKFKAGLLCALAAAGLTTSVVVYSQARARLGAPQDSLRRQADQLARLEAENQRLFALSGKRDGSDREEQLREMPALRAQAEALRRQTNDLARLRAENRRLSQRPGDEPKTPVQSREELIARATAAKDWLLAFMTYAQDHHGQCPSSFEQAAATLANDSQKVASISRSNDFDIVFQGSFDALTNLGRGIVVLRQRQPRPAGDGKVSVVYGLADGSVQQMRFPQPGYDTPAAWENEHILSAPGH